MSSSDSEGVLAGAALREEAIGTLLPEVGGGALRQRPGFLKRLARRPTALLGFLFLLLVHLAALLAPYVTSYSPEAINLANALATPSRGHWLGTDEVGRDVYTRLVYGARASLAVGIAAVAISIVVGTALGASAGYWGGWYGSLVMRVTDAFMSIPIFFLLLTVLTLFGSSIRTIILVIGLTSWMNIVRIVRGEVLRCKVLDFVEAARSVGATDLWIIWKHIIPHTVPAIAVSATLGVAYAILVESSLSYLGLGVQPPVASWGNMLSKSQSYIWTSPQLALYPGVAILLTVLAFNWFGDGLRDALSPSHSREG